MLSTEPPMMSPRALRTSPIAFTTTSAETMTSPNRAAQEPRPAGTIFSSPAAFPHASFGEVRNSIVARAIGVVRAGPPKRFPRIAQIEDHSGGNDRDGTLVADGQAATALAQPAHHAVGRTQAERRATGEQNRVDALDEVPGIHHVELARAGGTAAHAHRGPEPGLRTEHDGAAGAVILDRRMTDRDTGDGGEIRARWTH